ncbi:MAG: hypothetical protein ABJC79_09175 [Acidimicrobiia bacterium]
MTLVTTDRGAFRRRRVAVGLALLTIVAVVGYLVISSGDSRPAPADVTAAGSTGRTARTRHRNPSRPAAAVNIYAATQTVEPPSDSDPARVYVPSGLADTVTVIDPVTKRVLSSFSTGRGSTPQHVVPSFDRRSLWVLLNKSDQVVRIDAHTGAVGAPIPVNDPYNMSFTRDGRSAIIVAELHARLDFRDPQTMAPQASLPIPGCRGLNHADFSADYHSLFVTCEFAGTIAKIDVRSRRVVAMLSLRAPGGQKVPPVEMPDHSMATSMPQDIRLSPNGRELYVADMLLGGVHVVDGSHMREIGFIATGVGAHSVTPSHDGRLLYIANRGSTSTHGGPHGPGSVSVVDAATDRVITTWPVPGGGSPDMGNLTADGRDLWLAGRFDSEVYVFDTTTGALTARIPVPRGPHGLAVWPLGGHFSLGHTGNMR